MSEEALRKAMVLHASRVGIELRIASRGELCAVARAALPSNLLDDLDAAARAHGCEPDDLVAVFVAPLVSGGDD